MPATIATELDRVRHELRTARRHARQASTRHDSRWFIVDIASPPRRLRRPRSSRGARARLRDVSPRPDPSGVWRSGTISPED